MRTKVRKKQKLNLEDIRSKSRSVIKKGWYQVERQLHRPRNENKQSSNFNFNYAKLITPVVIGVFIFLVIMWLLGAMHSVTLQAQTKNYNLLTNGFDFDKAGLAGLNILKTVKTQLKPFEVFEVFVASVIIGGLLSQKFNFESQKVAHGQKGNARFTTIKELEDTYVKVPDHSQRGLDPKKPSFKGYGGFPIAHISPLLTKHGYYFIDTSTVHNLIVGTSRSGKGETTILEQIDLVSRAEKQSSLVVNDPKGELYVASVETLKKRGYDVYELNLDDPNKGIAFNPLQLIIRSWEQGDVEGAMQLVNSITYSLYFDKQAGQNKWVNDGAQSAVNGMIIALIEYCMNPKNFDDHKTHPEYITFVNISDMVNQLGQIDYINPADPYTQHNVLSEYFKHLKQGSIAKKEFGSTNFSGDKARGSIFSTVVQKLDIFTLPKNSRMTSMNTLEMKSIGFPKYLEFQLLDQRLYGNLIKIIFRDEHHKKLKTNEIRVSQKGFVENNFDVNLKSGSYVEIQANVGKQRLSNTYKLKIDSNVKDVEVSQVSKQGIRMENFKMHYSDKPIAVFMKIPDSDASNNLLATIFVNQLYTELSRQCRLVQGGKTVRRVQCIFDEFGSMIPLQNMDQIMTVSAGRNILFTLVVQSYSQLYSKYGKEDGQVIKENCQNKCLIMSTDSATNKEFSEACGNRTIEVNNISKDKNGLAKNISVSLDKVPLILPERLEHLAGGERLVLRPLTRMNKWGWAVTSHPIFNTGKTLMPFAHTFLSDDFNPKTNPDLVEKIDAHASLDLKSLEIDWGKWLNWTDQVPVQQDDGTTRIEEQNLALQAYNQYRQSNPSAESSNEPSKEENESTNVDNASQAAESEIESELAASLNAATQDNEDEDKVPSYILTWVKKHEAELTYDTIADMLTKAKNLDTANSVDFTNLIYKDEKLKDQQAKANDLVQEFSKIFNNNYQDK
ncbi:VirD4-like conjugal transfer protein, CD1115 family [Lactobacillus sp. HT06-2]|uniref:VirD4-like conjugal transfer protein, CD1115 family n=1 Tax=Lactobacillus sp. HT06-2 TaxID=2080222 RepID=UPI000CD92848|nr:type IV secretory system conjugative DNA transfer family protein [Lactobacillus sp. HT06-2]